MKKKLYYIYLVILTALVAGCQDEAMFTAEDDGLVTVSYRVKVGDDLQSRAIGDGTQVNQLIVGVFQDGEQINQYTYEVKERTAEINIPLLKTETYDLVFWAHTSGNGIYDTSDLNDITIDYSEFSKTQAEGIALDAFYTTREGVTVANPGTTSIELRRPFSQVSFGVYGNDIEKNKISSAEIIVNGTLYTGFKPLAEGEKAVEGDEETYSFEFTDLEDKTNSFIISGKEYTHLTANYFLVPTTEGTNATIGGTVRFKDENGNIVSEFTFEDAPLLANTRVNIGKGLTEVWDGVIVESLPEADEDGVIHIETTQQMAYLIKYGIAGADAENRKKLHLCKDLDMNGQVIARDGNYAVSYVEFDGGENTLYHLGTPLFDIATDIVIKDLSIDGAEPEVDSHVGVLVNTLRGNGRFENITISNSMAETENGAAGGIVGYIVRKSEKERSETLHVTFTNCDLVNVEVSGSESEGKFVGLLSGYDNGETLSFDVECSADDDTEVSDFESPYIVENQSVWLIDEDEDNNLDETYDGWLGTETYRRGVVMFDGIQLVPKWDGTTTVEPLLAESTYDGDITEAGTNKFVVYSPFDLAGVRKKTASPAAIYLRADIDMNGQGADGEFNVPSNFTQSAYSSTDDNVFDPFSYVTTLDGKKSDTENNSIYNLSISQIEQERAAFILYASGTTSHKNINFRNCQTVAVHKEVTTDAKAYGAILVSNVDATYTMENVHAYDCKVFALQKVGTLGARISGTSTLKNNSVNNCYVENYECMISERFDSGKKEMAGYTARVYADFYPHGEVGGMYGFIQGTSTLTDCNVNSTMVYAYGQNDKKATIEGDALVQFGIALLGYYLVPGRHVSTMIGNIRATGAVTLTNCKVDSSSKCTNRWDIHQWRKQTGGSWLRPTYTYYPYDYIGQAYYVEFLDSKGSVTVDGTALTLGDCKDGTLYGTK